MTMQHLRGLGQDRAVVRAAPEPPFSVAAAPTTKEIPYDYVARFILTGTRGNRVEDVINISIEGAFVAVAIGYSFIPGQQAAQLPPIPLGGVITAGTAPPSTISLFEIIAGTIADKLNLATADRTETVNQLGTLIQTIRGCLQVQLCGIVLQGYKMLGYGTLP
jgi:hypothetical protein